MTLKQYIAERNSIFTKYKAIIKPYEGMDVDMLEELKELEEEYDGK